MVKMSIVAALGAVMWLVLCPREPIYDGKPINYWINHPHTEHPFMNPGTKRFNSGEVYFPKVDSNAVPFLIRALNRRDGRFNKAYRTLYYKMYPSMRRLLPSPKPADAETDELIRLVAVVVLGRIGSDAKPAIPELIHVLKTDESDFVRTYAAILLVRFVKSDKTVSKALWEAMNDKDGDVRVIAAEALNQDVSKAAAVKESVPHDPLFP